MIIPVALAHAPYPSTATADAAPQPVVVSFRELEMMKTLLSRKSHWLTGLAAFGFIAGIVIAAAAASPKVFFTNLGFLLAGTSLGVGVAVWVIQAILNERTEERNKQMKAAVVKSVGGSSASAISRLLGGPRRADYSIMELTSQMCGLEGWLPAVFRQKVLKVPSTTLLLHAT